MTPKMPAYSWRNYDAYNDMYKLYAICGPGVSGVSVNFNNLDRSCTQATLACGSDLECVQQRVTYDHQSGTRDCGNNSKIDVLIWIDPRILDNDYLFTRTYCHSVIRPLCKGNFNLLVNPNPGSAGWYGYNGASMAVNSAYCTVYCT